MRLLMCKNKKVTNVAINQYNNIITHIYFTYYILHIIYFYIFIFLYELINTNINPYEYNYIFFIIVMIFIYHYKKNT